MNYCPDWTFIVTIVNGIDGNSLECAFMGVPACESRVCTSGGLLANWTEWALGNVWDKLTVSFNEISACRSVYSIIYFESKRPMILLLISFQILYAIVNNFCFIDF